MVGQFFEATMTKFETFRIMVLIVVGVCFDLISLTETFSVEDVNNNEVDGFFLTDAHPDSPASKLEGEIDILKLINVTAKDPGISLIEGPIKGYPAYKFRLPYGNVPLNDSTSLTRAMSNSSGGFTVVFLYRQQKNNLGTLLSINSPGRLTPWFQLGSNSKTGGLSLKYRTEISATSKLHQVDWSLLPHHRKSPLAAWTWLSLGVDFDSGLIRLDIDCLPSQFESLKNSANRVAVPSNALVYFRQEPGRKKRFVGSMQVAKVLPYVTHKRLWTCAQIASIPHNPKHRKPLVVF